MPTTTPYALPYPSDSDYVIDGASALQALAEATDDLVGQVVFDRDQADGATLADALAADTALETAWTALPGLSGTVYSGNTPSYRRDRAGNVHLHGVVENPGVIISTLPAGFRPTRNTYWPVYTFGTATIEPYLLADTAGNLNIPADSDVSLVSLGGIVYPAAL